MATEGANFALRRKGHLRLLELKSLFTLVFLAGCVALAIDCHGQGTPLSQIRPNAHDDYDGFNDSGNADQQKRLRALNADRHKGMVSDAEKLLKLARQLNAEIAENKTEGLTGDELRKVEAIEKLARSVKQKMILSWGSGPDFSQPNFPQRTIPPGRMRPGD